MRGQACYFFATRADLEPGLRSVERERPLRYALRGLFQSREAMVFASGLDIPDLGFADQGDAVREVRYLVVDAPIEIRVRKVPQKRGGVLYAVDEVANPTGIIFAPGGAYGDRCLISGQIDAVGDPGSRGLYHVFRRSVLSGFSRVKEFYVGPEAMRCLNAGFRLTQNVRAPAECDLEG